MFAAILRQWRIATPLALVAISAMIVAGAALTPASAHGLKFHFSGRALVGLDLSRSFPDIQDDTGPLNRFNPETRNTGHDVFGGTSEGFLDWGFGAATCASEHNSKGTEGKAVCGADAEEISIFGFETGVLCPNPESTKSGNDCVERIDSKSQSTSPVDDTECQGAFGNTNGSNDRPNALIFCADQVKVIVEAECELHNGHGKATVQFTSVISDLTAISLRGGHPQLVNLIGSDVDVPQSSFASTDGQGGKDAHDFLITIDETHIWKDVDVAKISVIGLHIIEEDSDQHIVGDFELAAAAADIHCAKHLNSDDGITEPTVPFN
jgi:hypothetical protein